MINQCNLNKHNKFIVDQYSYDKYNNKNTVIYNNKFTMNI
jgi:hypothetical protein